MYKGQFCCASGSTSNEIDHFSFIFSCCQCVCMFFLLFFLLLTNQSGVFVCNNHLNMCFYINRGQMSYLWLFLPACLWCFYDSIISFIATIINSIYHTLRLTKKWTVLPIDTLGIFSVAGSLYLQCIFKCPTPSHAKFHLSENQHHPDRLRIITVGFFF